MKVTKEKFSDLNLIEYKIQYQCLRKTEPCSEDNVEYSRKKEKVNNNHNCVFHEELQNLSDQQ